MMVATSLGWSFAIGVAGVVNLIAIAWAAVVTRQLFDMKAGRLDKDDGSVIHFAKLVYERYLEE